VIITKAAATVTPVESEHPNGEFDVILSTNDLDRDGDNLQPNEWKQPLPEHITFDSDHGMSVSTTVGSGKPFINDSGQLQVRGTFAGTSHGQTVRQLVNEGHIRSVSVAFMERKAKSKDSTPERELLNGAFVAVPANPKAVVLASKSVSTDELDELINQAAKAAVAEFVKSFAPNTSAQEGGEPQESAEEPAAESADAADEESAAPAEDAADDSADAAVMRARGLALSLRATALGTTTSEEQ
jgi:hypothetical protein